MIRIKILTTALVIIVLTAGCDFLDREISANYEDGQVFVNYDRMSKVGYGVYTYLFYRFGFNRIDGAMLASACDEAAHADKNSAIHRFNEGIWNASSNPEDYWGHFYNGIRSANLFLEESADYRNILYRDTVLPVNRDKYVYQVRDIAWLRAEVRFLRAFYHFELLKRYGGIPIMRNATEEEEQLQQMKRNSFEEGVQFVESECDSLIPILKDSWVGFDSERWRGRVTRGAAQALKARLLLYAASPLHNPTNDLTKWEKAAKAAHEVIASGKYELYGDYQGLFRLGNGADENPEVIFAIQSWNDNSYEKANYPIGYDQGGQRTTCPSQNLVDAYEMKATGMGIAEPGSSYDPAHPYVGRDPRLEMSVLVNEAVFKGRPVECYVGGKDGFGRENATTTGYYIRKYINEGLDLAQNQTSVHSWILFRYGEILLDYAEAMNEAYGPEVKAGFSMSAKAAVDAVRGRNGVGMPILPPGLTQEEMRERIRNERRVELAFEEHRFFDVRRWKIAEQTENAPLMGMKITKKPDGGLDYRVVKTEDRVFKEQMYLYPLPESEVLKGHLVQNPGW